MRGKCVAIVWGVLIAVFLTHSPSIAQERQSPTLNRIKRNGYVSCGIGNPLLGFNTQGENGKWQGFDVDFCRAVAAAILNDPDKVRFSDVETGRRKEELEQRRVDIIAARISASMTRETADGLVIPATTYFDGQGILVAKSLGISSIRELEDKTVCVQKGTVKADNISEYFRIRKIFIKLMNLPSARDTFERYERGECDAVTADMATLYAWRMMSPHAEEYTFIPDIVSKEPTGPVVLDRDILWVEIVRWVHMAMVNAEELGITRRNVEEEKDSPDLAVRRLLGVEGNIGRTIGLDNAWAYRIIWHVGNYGEVFERNLGDASQLKIKRGQNALWSEGGLQYGIPIR